MLWKWYLPLLWSRKLQTGTASFFFLFTPGWGIEGLKRGTINTNNRGREQTWKAARRRAISTAPGPAFKSPSAAMQTDMVKRVWHKPQSQTGLIHGAWQQATSSGATAASRPFSRGGGGSAALWWMVDGHFCLSLSFFFVHPCFTAESWERVQNNVAQLADEWRTTALQRGDKLTQSSQLICPQQLPPTPSHPTNTLGNIHFL